MKSKQEILDHLSKTVYTHNARRSIVGWMLQHHVVDYKCQIKFANHVYNRDGIRMTEGLSFEDFAKFAEICDGPTIFSLSSISRGMCEETAKELAEAVDAFCCSVNGQYIDKREDFQVGDVVKYIPDPDDTSDEYVEAIAHDSEGRVYLCLSNGEWVKPCYCVKYKYQGDERRALIDKLNEVL